MTADARTDKRDLRRRIRQQRAGLSAAERGSADTAIARQASALITRAGARTIACYLSAPTEPPTCALIAWASAHGVRVLLPISRPNGVLDWGEHTAHERVNELGVPETTSPPLGPGALGTAEIVFAPAAAADLEGHRLGWGGGYYDRALARSDSRAPVYAVLYDLDVVAHVPHEHHDVPISGAVTPTRTLSFER